MTNIVLGGGIGGLSAALYAAKLSKSKVNLYESKSRVGGWIQSWKTSRGTVFELGPRTMRIAGVAGNNTLELIEELGIQHEIRPVLRSEPAAKNRMLYVNGHLHSLPNNLTSLFKTVPPFSKPLVTALFQDLRTPPVNIDDDSIYNFVSRRFGKDIADYAVSSLVCGVCAGNSKEISVNLLMSKLFEFEKAYGGVAKGVLKTAFAAKKDGTTPNEKCNLAERAQKERWSVWSLCDGLERLPKRMDDVLRENENVNISLNSVCEEIKLQPSSVEIVVNGKSENAEHVFCSLPSHQVSKLISSQHQFLKDELSAIPFVTVGVVNIEYAGSVLPVQGFGFLVPPNQNVPILGVIFDTCCFPQDQKTVLTVMMGGHWFQKLFGASPSEAHLAEIAITEVKKALNILDEPKDYKVSILNDCIPQYVVGHKARVDRIRSYIKEKKLPLTLIGSSYGGIGVNDVILSSRTAVEESLKNK